MTTRLPSLWTLLATALLGAGALALLGAGLSAGGRTVLRQSFTEQPRGYIELYFTDPPGIGSGIVTVPVSLVDHGGRQTTYQLRSLIKDSTGRVTAQTTTSLAAQPGRAARAVLRLPAGADPALVEVDLTDHPQTLHYSVGGPPPAAPGGSP